MLEHPIQQGRRSSLTPDHANDMLKSQVAQSHDDVRPTVEDDRFQQLYAHSGLWSCCGYDILSLAFDLPLDAVQSLPEGQKRALVRLLGRLATSGDESLRHEVLRLESLSSDDRLAGLTQLSLPFLP